MKKKVLALLLASSMVAGVLAGCGNKAAEETKVPETTESSSATETEGEAEAAGGETASGSTITLPLAEAKEFSQVLRKMISTNMVRKVCLFH